MRNSTVPLNGSLKVLGVLRVFDDRFGLQNISNAITRYSRSWQDDEHHRQHEEGKNDLHGILHEGHHVANLHRRLGDLMSADPDNQQGHSVHDHHHHRHHDNHDPVDEQAVAGQILIGFIETGFFERLHVEGPDDHHPGQVFTRHEVEPVNQALDDLEFWQGNREYGQDQAEKHDDRQGDDPPHVGAFADGPDHATDPDDGCIENHAHHHDDDHLDLGDIVRRPGNQRSCGELVKLCSGKAFDPLEHIPAQIARQPGCCSG